MYRPSISISLCLFLVSLNFIINLGHCREFNSSISTKDGAIEADQGVRNSSQADDSNNRVIDAELDRPTDSNQSVEAAAPSEKENSSKREEGNDAKDDVKAANYTDSLPTRANCKGASCQFQSVCGKAPLNQLSRTRSWMEPYMINGENVKRYGEWPSYALLSIYHSRIRQYGSCGGTLVSDRHVLTAAHCMFDPRHTKASPGNVVVVLGDHTISQMDQQEKRLKVSSICVPRGYLPHRAVSQTINDYAVLTLTDRVPFSNNHQPACLPHATGLDTRRAQCYLIGAGAVGYQSNRPIFPKVINQMRVRSESCRSWGFGYSDRYRECYSRFDGRGSACIGDSGGPILCLDPRTKRWTVMATVSYGRSECSVSRFGSTNSVYARITTMLPAISAECGL